MKPTGDSRIDNSRAKTVVGSDEVGYGAWAGPLVVAAVATPREWSDPRVKDSKKLSEKARETLYAEFFQGKFPMSVKIVTPTEVDEMGVWKALIFAHEEALKEVLLRCSDKPLVVLDGNVPVTIEGAVSVPKADDLVPAVSLASIIAKVTRDRIMAELAREHPGYGFARHKGYGTPEHTMSLSQKGPCPAHRLSYEPVSRAKAALTLKGDEDIWDILDESI